ncbi:hypothetical protein NKH18_02040 [Streptomyces sp. M10(2022)]
MRLSAAEATRLHRWAAARPCRTPVFCRPCGRCCCTARRGERVRAGGLRRHRLGRGITLDAVERMLGPMRNCLPMAVRVDPAHQVGRLLTALRDRALDMAAYEWVSAAQIEEWTGRATKGSCSTAWSLWRAPAPVCDAAGRTRGSRCSFRAGSREWRDRSLPVSLLAHRGADGSLTLTAVHDRARISDADAGRLVGHCARLLRHLPVTGERATVADILAVLGEEEPPRLARRQPGEAA